MEDIWVLVELESPLFVVGTSPFFVELESPLLGELERPLVGELARPLVATGLGRPIPTVCGCWR